MDYGGIYRELVSRARKHRSRGYTEAHHVIPKCVGGSDSKDNLVNLSPREHQFAHKLLVKMFPGNYRLAFAANMMYSNSKFLCRNGRSPEWVRKEVSEMRKRAWSDPEKREEMRRSMLDAWKNNDRRAANSNRMRSYWSDPAARKANSEKLKSRWLRSKKMTESDVQEAAALKLKGSTWTELSEKFNIKRTTIRRYVQQRLTVSD